MTVTQHSPGTGSVNGGPPGKVIPLAKQLPAESWQAMKQWADQRGWGSWRCARAMILAATPEERKRLPEQRHLAGYWRLKGEAIPDVHRSDPNATGVYLPIIARMMGATPDKIWPGRKAVSPVPGDLKDHRDRTAGALASQRRKLDDLRRQAQLIQQLEDSISTLEAELRYLDAILAVPASADHAHWRWPMDDITGWDQANKAYTVSDGQQGERNIQRLESVALMTGIEPLCRVF